MMKSTENFNNFINEAQPFLLELARVSRKHMLVGEHVSVWLDKTGAEVSASIENDGEIQGRQRDYKYNFDDELKVKDITTLQCDIEVDNHG